jgi:hypothetical protein
VYEPVEMMVKTGTLPVGAKVVAERVTSDGAAELAALDGHGE